MTLPAPSRSCRSLLAGVSVLVSTTAISPTCFADEPSAQIEEIVVSARRREEDLQTVPVSVVAYTADELEMRSISSLSEVAQATPNFTFGQQAQAGSSAGVVFIRGVGQKDTLSTFDPGVGIYVDGVYLGRMNANDLDTMDVERLEVLRGPQGTLFGKNTNGGAVSIVTRRPDVAADETHGRFQVTTGSRDRIDVLAGVDLPLKNDTTALQLLASRRSQDGYSTRVDGEEQADTDRYSGRMALLYKPNDQFEAFFSADGTTFNETTSAYRLVDVRETSVVPMVYAAFTPFRYDDRWVTADDFSYNGTGPNRNDGTVWGSSLTMTWDRNWGTFKSITSYREFDIESALDPDGSPLTVLDVFQNVRQDQISQEFNVAGRSFDNRLDWVAGLYYFRETAEDRNDFNVALEFFGGAANFTQNLNVENDSYAVYGQGTYALNERLKLTAGGRVTYEKKEVGREQVGFPDPIPQQPRVSPSDDWTSFSPRIGLDYQWTPELMTYISAAQGFKSGGFNGRAASVPEFNRFDPEKVWTYEIGIRSDWLDRRLRFNATAFYSDYTDLQIQINASVTDPVTGQPVPFTLIGNIPEASIVGGEIDFMVVPVSGLKLIGGLGIADGEYRKLIPGSPMSLDDEFVDTPKVTYTASLEYARAIMGNMTLTGRIDYTHKSEIEFDYGNSPLVDQSPYGLLNARLTLDVSNSGLSFAVFGRNLTDEHYALGGHDDGEGGSLGFVLQQMGAPREWGISAEYRF